MSKKITREKNRRRSDEWANSRKAALAEPGSQHGVDSEIWWVRV